MAFLLAFAFFMLAGLFSSFYVNFILFNLVNVHANSDHASEAGFARKRPEDSIPVIELRGEGKPMTPGITLFLDKCHVSQFVLF